MMKAMSPRHSRPLPQDPTIHRGAAIVRQQLLGKGAPDEAPQRPSWTDIGEICDECTTEDDDVWVEYNDKSFRRNSIEVDPPSGDNWSVDAEEYSVSPDDLAEDVPPESPAVPRASPVKAAAPLPHPYHSASPSRQQHSNVGGFISSEGEDDDDDIETNYSEDIVEIDEPMSHPFFEPVANVVVVSSKAPKETRQPPNSMSISSGSSSEDRPVVAPSKTSNGSSSRGPLHLQKEPPRSTFGRPSIFEYNVDVYCGYDVDTDDVEYDSPEKQPVTEVPVRSTPGTTVSNLSTPDSLTHRPTLQQHQISSALMFQYDKLLRDPAYLHAQNAGFIWQSLVGQHIRFPSSWWNGARGPPMGMQQYGGDGDQDTIPWMYFGRHSVKRNSILNQLVKCRASAGRLLLHIIVQDLMTRTPIQDICIGCFHPNAKGVRPSGSPALKRLEECRDVWMAVRKRHPQAVAATDSLLYAPHHWTGGGSDAEYAISRSPLGPGQRVTNTNVRSVFGDKAPLETIFLSEDELYERLATHVMQQHNASKSKRAPPTVKLSPPMAILQEFVFA
jgi:hypothetical protein